jgi:hypothetical protein
VREPPLKDRLVLFGYATLIIGIALLAFTFVSAYIFLSGELSIAGTPDLVTVFGAALAPLIETCIRIMYLGIMGWIGSILTIRGVQLTTQLQIKGKPEVTVETRPVTAEKQGKSLLRSRGTKKPTKGRTVSKTPSVQDSS